VNKAAIGLVALGLLQMSGDLLGLRALKGIGAATVASPAPKGFTTAGGLETFSTRSFVEWTDTEGVQRSLALTPEAYGRLHGPYNRRNVFGAVLAFGPVVPAELRNPVMRYAACGKAPVLRELGIDTARIQGRPRVRFEPRPGTDTSRFPLVIEVRCP
jgi:hypothetical protein